MRSNRLGNGWLMQAVSLWVAPAAMVTVSAAGALFPGGSQTTSVAPVSRQEFLQKLAAAATERTNHSVRYDGSYVRIPYPGGDVPGDTGVCTDEIIRSYRTVRIDLPKQVHEDSSFTTMRRI